MTENEKQLLVLLNQAYQQLLNVKEECVASGEWIKAKHYRTLGVRLNHVLEDARLMEGESERVRHPNG
jgi:hypothetical protein